MSDKSSIEWTEATWNPSTGCTKVSPGCDNCYAETFSERFRGVPGHHFEQGFDLTLRPERLDLPLRWRKPRRIFVNSMSDLFHDDVPDDFIAKVFAVMALTPRHTYQVLTKRHGRMRSLLRSPDFKAIVALAALEFDDAILGGAWPLRNVWLGVSVENQQWADIRVPALLDTPAAVRWLSCEPLLGPVNLLSVPDGECGQAGPAVVHHGHSYPTDYGTGIEYDCMHEPGIDWVVVGGESGPGARPMHPGWARSLRDQCAAASVPFFFKQWGEWAPNGYRGIGNFTGRERLIGDPIDEMGHRLVVERMGKKAAGRELDGRTWDEYPVQSAGG